MPLAVANWLDWGFERMAGYPDMIQDSNILSELSLIPERGKRRYRIDC